VSFNSGSRVSGSVTFDNLSVPSPASVTVQRGSHAYGVSMSIPGPVGTTQAGTFSISDVSSGTYSYIMTFSSLQSSIQVASFVINGGTAYPLSLSGTYNSLYNDYDWTATISGIVISDDVTIDLFIQH
jgi:hypothetical protein